MCNTAIYKLYYGILFFSLSEHKANLTELHPKVRQTCTDLQPSMFETRTKLNGKSRFIWAPLKLIELGGGRMVVCG